MDQLVLRALNYITNYKLTNPTMKTVCIIGCGAVGSLFGAHLAKQGEAEVWAYDVSKEHVDAIRKHGLRLSGAADFTAKLHATSDPQELPHCDYGIVATKSIHTRAAIAQVARAFDDQSAVCSVQNGVGNEEIIADHVRYVIRGTTFPAGHPIAPGHIGFDIKGDTWIGPPIPRESNTGSTSSNREAPSSRCRKAWSVRRSISRTTAAPTRVTSSHSTTKYWAARPALEN